jgi:glycosyltransferase involved in cell wall biosynthesis
MNQFVSFVIPAFNEEELIGAAIASIHLAMKSIRPTRDYEVLVVDDDSQDATAEIARQNKAQVLQVHERNIAAVRNAGAFQAQGDVLIFVDADTQVSPGLVTEALQAMERGGIWGTALAVPLDDCPVWGRLGLAAYNQYHVRYRQCGYGFFFFVRRQAFLHVHGFPQRTKEGEDTALSKLLRLQYGRPVVLHSRVATSARKTRMFGFWYHLRMVWLTIRYGDEAYSRPEICEYRDGALRLASCPARDQKC